MKIKLFLTGAALMGIGVVHLFAQQAKGKPSHAPAQLLQAEEAKTDSPVISLFPDFYSFWPVDKNDTVMKYECFDSNDSLANTDTLRNMDGIKFILLVKTFTDYMRTYVDAEGRPQPMPVTTSVYRYDKSGRDRWVGKEFATKEYTYYKELKNDIVRSDTTSVTNPATGNKQLTIHRYYKTEQVSPDEK